MEKKFFEKRKSSSEVDYSVGTITGLVLAAILLAILVFVLVLIFGLSIFVNSTNNGTYTAILNNGIALITNFFATLPVVGTILGVVVLIAVILILVLLVSRMKNLGGGASSSGAIMTG